MNTLTKLKNDLALIRVDQAKLAAKLGEIGAERHAVESASSDRAASIAVAEQALVDALAAHELGEPADVDGAQQRLNDARLESHSGIDTATRLRVLDALRARHEGEHVALHERGRGRVAAIRAAETEAIAAMGADLLVETETAIAAVARNACLLDACRNLVAERGATWPHAILREAEITLKNQITPNQARAEIVAALAI